MKSNESVWPRFMFKLRYPQYELIMWSLVLSAARLKVKMQVPTKMLCFQRDLHMDALSMKFLIYSGKKTENCVSSQVVASSNSFFVGEYDYVGSHLPGMKAEIFFLGQNSCQFPPGGIQSGRSKGVPNY